MTQEIDKAISILKTALEMEKKGRLFYEKAMAQCKNQLGKDIFTRLRNDEIVHEDRIQAIFEEFQSQGKWGKSWKAFKQEHDPLATMFRNIALKHGPDVQADAEDLKALEIGIDFESEAIKFYEKHLEKATDPIEREFIKKMIFEEKDHHRALSDVHHYLSNPESWFEEKERSGLDGA